MSAIRARNVRNRYTDVCLVIGPNRRWVENDYEDLLRHTTALLGYRVEVATVDEVTHGRLRGIRPTKIIVSDEVWRSYRWQKARAMLGYVTGRIEVWHVHRGEGVWKVGDLTDLAGAVDTGSMPSTPPETEESPA